MAFVEPRIFEVFRRDSDEAPMLHVGSVIADSALMALRYARVVYAQNGEHTELWVAERGSFFMVDDANLLQSPSDHEYHKLESIAQRDKLVSLDQHRLHHRLAGD